MFDALKNLGNLRELMGKAQEVQQQMKQLQEEMAKRTATARPIPLSPPVMIATLSLSLPQPT